MAVTEACCRSQRYWLTPERFSVGLYTQVAVRRLDATKICDKMNS